MVATPSVHPITTNFLLVNAIGKATGKCLFSSDNGGTNLHCRQWGRNYYGVVAFPISFTKFSRVVLSHPGMNFYMAKCRENSPLNSFTLDVGDNSLNNGMDAIWIAIGV